MQRIITKCEKHLLPNSSDFLLQNTTVVTNHVGTVPKKGLYSTSFLVNLVIFFRIFFLPPSVKKSIQTPKEHINKCKRKSVEPENTFHYFHKV